MAAPRTENARSSRDGESGELGYFRKRGNYAERPSDTYPKRNGPLEVFRANDLPTDNTKARWAGNEHVTTFTVDHWKDGSDNQGFSVNSRKSVMQTEDLRVRINVFL